MSNQVGPLYRSVIEGVLSAARLDFEDNGEDPSVLDLLQAKWRERLTSMRVTGDQPWDEENASLRAAAGGLPDTLTGQPVPQAVSVSGMPSMDMYSKPESAATTGQSSMPNLFIKDEPGSGALAQQQTPYSGDAAAALRAAQHIQQYATRGDPGAPLTAGVPQAVRDLMNRAQQQAHQQPQQPQNQAHPTATNQVPRQGQLAPHLQQQLEAAMSRGPLPQTDGPSADDEEVGSDLDDSEDDELNSENDDEDTEQSQIMLCLYDKVQRVKNKWKYTLKDGVANVNGLDYVFARANGESEW